MADTPVSSHLRQVLIKRELPSVVQGIEPVDSTESNSIQHAVRELNLAGVMDKDSDYGGMLGAAVLDLVRVFAAQGHSGMSADMTLQLFTMIVRFQNLTPLTDDEAEWLCHVKPGNDSPDSLSPSSSTTGMWQSKRNSEAFSYDGGKTYKLLSTGDVIHTAVPAGSPS